MKKLLSILLIVLLPLALFAQRGAVTGKVTDASSGEALVGANVLIKGTALGAASGLNGVYKIVKVPPGSYTLRATFIGHKMQEKEVQVLAGQEVTVDFVLEEDVIYGEAIGIIADRAKERETPVAFTNVEKLEMVQRLGSQDIPLILNTTPSVYATMQGGGAGDARVNVRGFNQRNVAIMINGVPVNDMENGWVYWSNWDGVADATSSIQVQRGLSAVNLATPSIGGTMNIITDPTQLETGFGLRQEVGNDGFLKTTVTANSGLINEKLSFNGLVVRKTGDGLIDATWTDAWAYYFGASYNINPNNRIELYAIGAPQRHGQNSYKQNLGVYNADLAKDMDEYDNAALNTFSEVDRKYNQTWNNVDPSYKGKQYWRGKEHDRYDPNFINERENYYHKPIVNLNWYTKLSDDLSVYTVLYYSGGKGGGTGTYGSMRWDYSLPSRRVDWDATIARNQGSETGAFGILRNSVNEQWTIGAISKANYKLSDNMKTTFGVDWRTARIFHWREVRDLLGGEYFLSKSSQFWPEEGKRLKLGDKFDYDFTNDVDWYGGFGQVEYSTAQITAYGMAGYSIIKYKHTNHFKKGADGNEAVLEADPIGGFQVKGGASYRFTTALNAFANVGYVSKVPIFDNVISDYTMTIADDPKNEQFISFEAGLNWIGLENKLTTKLNVYHTTWKDRAVTRGVTALDGSEAIVFLSGLNALHQGVEFEAAYQPMSLFRLDMAASIGNWKHLDDVNARYQDYSTPDSPEYQYNLYIEDIKVGDAPQTQLALAASVYPIPGAFGQLVVRHYRDHYADYDPVTRADATDRAQSWKTPPYTVMDFHAAYTLPFNLSGIKLQLFAHVFNLLDAIYVQDAVDNSRYNAYLVDGKIANPHQADAAEVFLGLPRTFNIGLQLNY